MLSKVLAESGIREFILILVTYFLSALDSFSLCLFAMSIVLLLLITYNKISSENSLSLDHLIHSAEYLTSLPLTT